MAISSIAIVGRPNVGKSSVFNWLAGRRIAIVDPTAGVTRDRVSTLLEIGDRKVELFDTGGMGIEDADDLTSMVEKQIHYGMEQASLLLFVVDARDGVVPLDESIAQKIHAFGKPVILVVNKCDAPSLDVNSLDFYQLGFSKLLCVSAQQNRGKEDLLKLISKNLPDPQFEALFPDDVTLKLAIVGRRNTGKSTFINCLAKAERMIVSEVPGTTRDSVDVRFEQDGKTYLAIDTAGVRKRKSLASDIEYYSLHRAERSIRRADVVLLFFDASKPVSRVDKKLAEYILEQNKTAIFVMNKWDLLRPMPTGTMVTYVRSTFPSLDHVPVAFITAKSGKNVQAVLNLAQSLHKQASIRISTGELNRVVRDALARNEPPMRKNRRAKVLYATQAEANPPTIILFVNDPTLFDNTYLRYLVRVFRKELPFQEVAIRLELRRRNRGVEQAIDDEITDETKPKIVRSSRKKKSTDPGVWTDI